MKRLFLLRHGEAGFAEGTDHDRALTSRGIEQLQRLGASIAPSVQQIDLVLCSTAQRTRQTAEILNEYVPFEQVDYLKVIYEGNMSVLLDLLSKVPDTVSSCLLVGHNPIISLLLAHLSGDTYQSMAPGTFAQLTMLLDSWELTGINSFELLSVHH